MAGQQLPNRILFISIEDFKFYEDLSNHFTNKQRLLVEQYIRTAQQQYVMPLLCEDYYSELIDKLSTNPDTLTVEDEALLYGDGKIFEGVRGYLVYLSYKLYIERSGKYSTPAGIRKPIDDNSDPLTDGDKTILLASIDRSIEFYKRALKAYLSENGKDIPTYAACTNCNDLEAGNAVEELKQISALGQNKNRYSEERKRSKYYYYKKRR